MKRIALGFIIVVFLIFFSPGTASSWVESSARSLGLGGAYTALARSTEATFENPAFLVFGRNSYVSFLSLGVKIANNSFSLKDYNAYNGKFLKREDKDKILSLVPENGLNLHGDLGASLFGAKIGKFGLGSRILGISDLSFPKKPLEIILHGNSVDQRIEVEDLKGEALLFYEVALSYATKILSFKRKPLYAGLNFRWIKGVYYQKITEASGFFETKRSGIYGQGDFATISARGGNGFSFDLGFASLVNEKVTLGLALVNVFNSINWNKNTQRKVYRISSDSLTFENSDDDSAYIEQDYTEDIGSFKSRLPLIVKGGVSYKLKNFILAADLEQGFKNSAGSSKVPKLSLGTEYNGLSWLQIRSGVILGGKERLAICWGVGIKIKPSFVDFGMSTNSSFWPSKGKGIGLFLSSGIAF